MKAAALFCCALALLLAALCASFASAAPVGPDALSSCCFTYPPKKIHRNYVVGYYRTNGRCSQPAVVFITRKGRKVCANPTERWVQEYVKSLELKRSHSWQG